MLRDPKVVEFGDGELDELARQIKDHNYRIFAEGGEVHLRQRGTASARARSVSAVRAALNPGFGGAADTHSGRNLDPATPFTWATKWRRRRPP